ncbi:MAG: metallophosphoesterase, partial [Chloroflexota bacterium]
EGGIVYLVTGGGGATLYPVGASWFTASSRAVHHFTRVTLSGCQAQIEAIDSTGAVFDSATLQRC